MPYLYRLSSCLLVLLCSLAVLLPRPVWAQDFTQTNHAYWYQPDAPLQSSLQLWRYSPDSLEVSAALRLNPNNPQPITTYEIYLHQKHMLDSAAGLAIPIPLQPPAKQAGNFHLFKARIPLSDSLNYLLLEVVPSSLTRQQTHWAMAVLHPEFNFPPPSFYLQEAEQHPLFQDYTAAGTPLLLEGRPANYSVFQYRQAFKAAAPPMSPPNAGSQSLELDSLFFLSADSAFRLNRQGLYFFQHDTTQLIGRSVRIVSPYFPEVGTLEEFAGPIRYISSNEEWARLEAADFSKKEIDRFWLSVAQNKERARRIIKTYYQQVAEANRLFTNYKEGWKTDQGMIYILYGSPDFVEVEAGKEEWIYRKTARNPEIKFIFVRVKNPFTDRHFVLVRSKNYTKSHYQIVSQWRRGRKTL